MDNEFWRDFAYDVMKWATHDEPYDLAYPDYMLPATVDDLKARLAEMDRHAVVSLDIETTGFDPQRDEVTAIGIGTSKDEVLVIGQDLLAGDEREAALDALWDALWPDPLRRVILHNGKFDLKFLAHLWGAFPTGDDARLGDTMLLHHLLDERPVRSKYRAHGLKDLARVRYDVPDYSFDHDAFKEAYAAGTVDDDAWLDYYAYLAMDCRVTARLWHDLVAEANEESTKLLSVHDDILMPGSLALAEAELRGIPVDLDYIRREERRLTRRIERRTKALRDFIDDQDFNPGSAKQFTEKVMMEFGVLPTPASELGIRDIAESGLGQYSKYEWNAQGFGDSAAERERRRQGAIARRAGAAGQYTGLGQYAKLDYTEIMKQAKIDKEKARQARVKSGGISNSGVNVGSGVKLQTFEEIMRQAKADRDEGGKAQDRGRKYGPVEGDEPITWPNVAAKRGNVKGEYVEPPTSTGLGEMRELITRFLKAGRRHEARWIASVLEYRLDVKQRAAYVRAWLDALGPDDRVHAEFNLGGTVTGRLSSSGPNMHAIPKRGRLVPVRKQIAAPPGWTLVEADYSQLELRVAAILSGDKALTQTYAENRDLHLEVASLMLGKPADQVSEPERYLAKAVDFGVIYGRSAQAIATGDAMFYAEHVLGYKPWTIEETETFLKKFLDGYPELRDWLKTTGEQAAKERIIETPLGRRRRFVMLKKEPRYIQMLRRQGVNTPIQSLASDICLAAFSRLSRELDRDIARPISIVHDSILVETRADKVDEVAVDMKRLMEVSPIDTHGVPLAVDVKYGQTLADGDMHKWKHEEGREHAGDDKDPNRGKMGDGSPSDTQRRTRPLLSEGETK